MSDINKRILIDFVVSFYRRHKKVPTRNDLTKFLVLKNLGFGRIFTNFQDLIFQAGMGYQESKIIDPGCAVDTFILMLDATDQEFEFLEKLIEVGNGLKLNDLKNMLPNVKKRRSV